MPAFSRGTFKTDLNYPGPLGKLCVTNRLPSETALITIEALQYPGQVAVPWPCGSNIGSGLGLMEVSETPLNVYNRSSVVRTRPRVRIFTP